MNAEKSPAEYIDHTLLRPAATADEIRRLCAEAREYSFAAVCVNPSRVELASAELEGSSVKVCAVTGFPLGATTTQIKSVEALYCVENGASEVDMVMNIGEAKDGNWKLVESDIAKVARTVHENGGILKVILENCFLEREEIVRACRASVSAGADFVKTSTGFGGAGAKIEDVRLMAGTVGERCLVKAAGGIRTLQDALDMIDSGAARLGTSSGVAIINGLEAGDQPAFYT